MKYVVVIKNNKGKIIDIIYKKLKLKKQKVPRK